MRIHRTIDAFAAAVLLLCGLAAPAMAQTSSEWPRGRRLQVTFSSHMELHNFLRVAASIPADKPGYEDQVNLYRRAEELIRSPLAWRFLHDIIAEGPDLEAIKTRASSPPGGLSKADLEGVRNIVQALDGAWDRFAREEEIRRLASLQRFVSQNLRRRFFNTLEAPVMSFLYDKMQFEEIDAPITIYPVIEAVELGVWGKTSDTYYIVVPVSTRTPYQVIESIIHETIHVLDLAQPAGSKSALRKMRDAGKGVDPAEMDRFLHGLVVWSSGDVIRRIGPATYVPTGDQLPNAKSQIDPYRALYEGPWRGYFDDLIGLDRAIKSMIGGLKPKGQES